MKRISKIFLALILFITTIVVYQFKIDANPSNVKIYSFYWGGGNKNATYERDYVVLFNEGDQTVSLNSMSLQYKNGNTHRIAVLSGQILPKSIYTLAGAKGKSGGLSIPSEYNVKATEDKFNIHTNGSSILALVNSKEAFSNENAAEIIHKVEFKQPSRGNDDALLVATNQVVKANDPITFKPAGAINTTENNSQPTESTDSISITDALSKSAGAVIKVKGTTLTTLNGGFGGKKGFYLFDNSGKVIYVYNELSKAIHPNTAVVVSGTMADYKGIKQISSVTEIDTLSNPDQYQPTTTTLDSLGVVDVAQLVKLENLTVTDFKSADNYGNESWTLRDSSNKTVTLRLDSRVTNKSEISQLRDKIGLNGVINLEAVATKYNNQTQLQLYSATKVIVTKQGVNTPVSNNAYEALNIGEIQSTYHYSPFMNKVIKLKNVVVTFKASNDTFYIQDLNPDNDPQTSDGLLVKTKFKNKVNVGDKLVVTGTIKENSNTGYFDDAKNYLPVTTLEVATNSDLVTEGVSKLPVPVIVSSLPLELASKQQLAWYKYQKDGVTLNNKGEYDATKYRIDYLESLEGMLIKYEKPIVVAPQNYGDIYVVSSNNADKLVNGILPLSPKGRSPYLLQIHVSKFSNLKNDFSIITKPKDYFSNDVVGVMDYGYGNYYLHTNLETLKSQNNINNTSNNKHYINEGNLQPEKTKLTNDQNKLSIASYNIENFSTNTEASKVERIARSFVEDLNKPDIISLIEIQDNDGATDSGNVDAKQSAQKLIDAIKELDNSLNYQYIDIAPNNNQDGGAPGGNIRVGYLYNSNRVKFNSNPGTADLAAVYNNKQLNANPVRISPINPAFNSTRKSLAAQFEFNGENILVIANHFSSKRGDMPLMGKYQPATLSSETNRHLQAQAVADFVKDVLTKNPEQKIVLTGDLNDFEWTKTVSIIEDAGMINLVKNHDINDRFSYSYQGSAQSLDQMLVSNNLKDKYQFDMVHVNSMFMKEHGRASDHDPLLVVIDFNKDKDIDTNNTNVSSSVSDYNKFDFRNGVSAYYTSSTFSGDVVFNVEKILNSKYPKNWDLYDISFKLGTKSVNPNQRVLISLPLNNRLASSVEVIHIDDLGAITIIPIEKIENNQVYFYAYHFSIYGLRSKSLPQTGVNK